MQCGHSSHSTAPRHGVKTKIFLELGFKAAAAQVEKPVPSQHAAEKVPCFLSNCGSTAQFVLGRGQRRYTQLTHQSPPPHKIGTAPLRSSVFENGLFLTSSHSTHRNSLPMDCGGSAVFWRIGELGKYELCAQP